MKKQLIRSLGVATMLFGTAIGVHSACAEENATPPVEMSTPSEPAPSTEPAPPAAPAAPAAQAPMETAEPIFDAVPDALPSDSSPADANPLLNEPPAFPSDVPSRAMPVLKDRKKPGLEGAIPDALETRVKLREARTKAERDPQLQELKLQAETAKTDPEKRALLQEYYNRLFTKISKSNKQLGEAAAPLKQASLNRVTQHMGEPAPTPAPADPEKPTKKKKSKSSSSS